MKAISIASQIVQFLTSNARKVTFAESCTGGGLAYALTDVPGSSECFESGFITYCNQSKCDVLGVDPLLVARFGAVSEEVVCAMAQGALNVAGADYSVAISGIAGPDGGSPEKPVGTVWIAWCDFQNTVSAKRFVFEGDRSSVREATIQAALQGLFILCGIEKGG